MENKMNDRPTPETDAFIASQNHSPTTHQLRNLARIFERERDAAREQATEQFIAGGKAIRERDEAREQNEVCRGIIDRTLIARNSALSDLTDLEHKRDEAREEADHWKTEYEIVVARLRGERHPRDNGIIAPDEIIPKLTSERDEAREALWRRGLAVSFEA